jgi:hypothetical protein
MRNLAGATTAHADAYIEDELAEACIASKRISPSQGEVKAALVGESGAFTFHRAWYYWVVTGPVPVELAWKLYNDPRGRHDVRVAGHCGCPEPVEPWIRKREAGDVVDEYHIDSQDGLNLFAELVLGTRPLPPTDEEKEAGVEVARQNTTGGRIIYEDDLGEADYLEAAQEIHDIRDELSTLRHRLDAIAKGADAGMGPHSHALSASHGLSLIIYGLYELEDGSNERSFPARAERTKKLWEDIYKNPTNYVLREKRDG